MPTIVTTGPTTSTVDLKSKPAAMVVLPSKPARAAMLVPPPNPAAMAVPPSNPAPTAVPIMPTMVAPSCYYDPTAPPYPPAASSYRSTTPTFESLHSYPPIRPVRRARQVRREIVYDTTDEDEDSEVYYSRHRRNVDRGIQVLQGQLPSKRRRIRYM